MFLAIVDIKKIENVIKENADKYIGAGELDNETIVEKIKPKNFTITI